MWMYDLSHFDAWAKKDRPSSLDLQVIHRHQSLLTSLRKYAMKLSLTKLLCPCGIAFFVSLACSYPVMDADAIM
jgi:hypothetical protein